MNAIFSRFIIAVVLIAGMDSCSTMKTAPTGPALREEDWVSYDGKVMPWKVWAVSKGERVRAVLITVHGLSGATSDFWPIGEALPNQGVAVYGYEIRGQGNDPNSGNRGHIRSRHQWLRDLETFDRLVRARHPAVPVFWHGTSLGSLIALQTAVDGELTPDGLILGSPLAGVKHGIGRGKRWLLNMASVVMPRKRLRLGDLAGVDENTIQVTADTTHGGQMAKTPHHVDAFSVRLLAEIGRLLESKDTASARWNRPTLVLASPQDVVASESQIEGFFEGLASKDKTLVWFKDSRHLLLHDVEREKVIETERDWLRARSTD